MEQRDDNGPPNKKRKLIVESDDIKNVCHLLSIHVGKLNVNKNKQITLVVDDMIIDAMDITQDEYEHLDNYLDTAYICQNNKKIIDTNICKYKHTENFSIDLDIKTILNKINIDGYIQKNKLNYYKTGDFYLPQRDTNCQGLIGTFILLLPSNSVGGELYFNDYNAEKDLDKSTLRFIYFKCGMEHSVTKVVSGNFLSLIYNIYDPNYHQKDEIVAHKIDIYFPNDNYKKLLNYIIEYCEGKKNILLGHYKYRDDIFNKRLRKDIKDRYDVIKVAVNKKTSINKITTVHELKRDIYGDDDPSANEPDGLEKNFDDLVYEEYKVRHKLFPKHFVLKYNKLNLFTKIGYRKYLQFEKQYSREIYTAYLINPKFRKSFSTSTKQKGYISEDDSDIDDDDDDDDTYQHQDINSFDTSNTDDNDCTNEKKDGGEKTMSLMINQFNLLNN